MSGPNPFLLLAAALLVGCSGGGPHSVLLVTLDTTRADALGAYGRVPSVTPNLDRLASEGVTYERAYTVAPLTLPAHASMLTGLYPPRHGVRDNGVAPLPRSAETLAERAAAAGFQTAAFLGSAVLDEGFGLEQGFETYGAPARSFYGGPTMGYAERPAAEVAELAIAWLKARDRERPFLLWAHLWDAHAPYEPPEALLRRAGGNPYLGEVAACDLAVGRILQALEAEDLLDSTLIVVVADHGESFSEHDEVSHGPFTWDTTLRVPLILRHPGAKRAGKRLTGLASVADVFPTALAAMDLEPLGPEVDGIDLSSGAPPEARGAYFESYYGYLNFGWHPLTGWVDARGKYEHGARARYCEPDGDPLEEHDLLAQRATQVAQARGALAEAAARPGLARDAEGIDLELKRSMQALGYAALSNEGTDVPEPLAELPLPDPHARTAELVDFQRAQGLLSAQKYAEAESALRRLVERYPENHFAWDRLALCLMRENRHAEAIAPLERVVAASRGNADTWTYLGACRLVVGEEEKAMAAFTRALELDPNHVHALAGLIHLMEAAGMSAESKPFQERFEAARSRP